MCVDIIIVDLDIVDQIPEGLEALEVNAVDTNPCTYLAFKVKTGLRDIACTRGQTRSRREKYAVTAKNVHTLKAESVEVIMFAD